MNPPETSMVIRTLNKEKFLPDLLAAIKQQDYRDHEIIVVDSGSMGRTLEIATQKADKLLAIESRDFTFGHSLNVGIQQTSGKYIVIVSAHTLPFNDYWLGNLIKPLHDDTTAMAYGRQLGGRSSNFSEAQDIRRTFGKQRRVLRPPRGFLPTMRTLRFTKIYGDNIHLMKDCWAWKILIGPNTGWRGAIRLSMNPRPPFITSMRKTGGRSADGTTVRRSRPVGSGSRQPGM